MIAGALAVVFDRGPFFSEVLAFNVKMEDTLEGQRELIALFVHQVVLLCWKVCAIDL